MAKYTIEIDRMTTEEITIQLEELLWSYCQFYLSDLKDVTLKEHKRLKQQSKLAWDTLQAAFGHKDVVTEKFLKDNSESAAGKLRRSLENWPRSAVAG
jgi:hypothetical protein